MRAMVLIMGAEFSLLASRRQQGLLPAFVLGAALALSYSDAQAQLYPAMGGSSGSGFTAKCLEGQHLAGLELRAGADIDAIRPVCVTVFGATETSIPVFTAGTGLIQRQVSSLPGVSIPTLPPGWFGGVGGSVVQVMCPVDKPIVIGIGVEMQQGNQVLNKIAITCGPAAPWQRTAPLPDAQHEAKRERASDYYASSQACEPGQFAIGVLGRYGDRLDALGLICGPLSTDGSRGIGVKPQPRVKLPGAVQTPVDICESAAKARARNSPAAAGLERQCEARTASAAQAGAEELARTRKDAAELTVRGRAIGRRDPYIISMRELFGNSYADSFDAGLAAAEGQTEWGPGKERLARSFDPPLRATFVAAVEYTLDRNRNEERVTLGSEIAQADPELAAARIANPDARFWLGFDIATSIFGDPALGAQGNTALGPGSLGIRAALSDLAKQGFDAALKVHLSRAYGG